MTTTEKRLLAACKLRPRSYCAFKLTFAIFRQSSQVRTWRPSDSQIIDTFAAKRSEGPVRYAAIFNLKSIKDPAKFVVLTSRTQTTSYKGPPYTKERTERDHVL